MNRIEYTLSEIFIYPVKGMGGISLNSAELTERGLQYDRRWMLVDANNEFISQRTVTKLCLFKLSFCDDGFLIEYESQQIAIPINLESGTPINVKVWEDTMPAICASETVNNFFTEILQQPCKLVYMADETLRTVDFNYAHNNEIVSFADAYPMMMIGQESLNLLNSKLQEKLPMNRFRPSIVFTGGSAHDEDAWQNFSINNALFKGVKLCARCAVPTINQTTAKPGKEPLKTLASYRFRDNKVYFGQNVLIQSKGNISVGQTIQIQSQNKQFTL